LADANTFEEVCQDAELKLMETDPTFPGWGTKNVGELAFMTLCTYNNEGVGFYDEPTKALYESHWQAYKALIEDALPYPWLEYFDNDLREPYPEEEE
jgi:hypothetical protein